MKEKMIKLNIKKGILPKDISIVVPSKFTNIINIFNKTIKKRS